MLLKFQITNNQARKIMIEEMSWQEKYERLKDFVRGKWKGDCEECAAIANTVLNNENNPMPTEER